MNAETRRLLALTAAVALTMSVFAPVATVGAETLAAGNAGVPTNSRITSMPTPVITPGSDSDVAVGYDFSRGSWPAPGDVKVVLVKQEFTQSGLQETTLDSVDGLGSASGTVGLTIPANTVTNNDTTIKAKYLDTSTGNPLTYPDSTTPVVAYGTVLVRNVDTAAAVDAPDVSTKGQSAKSLTVGYNAEGKLSDGDTLSVVFERDDGTVVDSATGLAGTPTGAVTLEVGTTSSAYSGTVELRKNGNAIASDAVNVTLQPYVSSSDLNHVSGTPLDTSKVKLDAKTFGTGGPGYLSLRLEDRNGNGYSKRDLSGLGADETTTLWVNLTVENFSPDVLMGAANVDKWSVTEHDDGSADVDIRLQPTEAQRNYDAWKDGVFEPGSWSTKYDASDRGMSAIVDLGIGEIPDSFGELEGARLNTDAQVYTVPQYKSGKLQFNVAAPHCKASASGSTCSGSDVNDDGFYEAVLPKAFVDEYWGSDFSPESLVGEYSTSTGTTESLDLNVSILPDGAVYVNATDIHYSSGTIALEEETTDPTASVGSDVTVTVGSSVDFDASSSTDNVGITSYAWDFDGDGTADATGATVSHTFDSAGTYDVTLTVTDGAGNSATATRTVAVEADDSESGGSTTQPPPVEVIRQQGQTDIVVRSHSGGVSVGLARTGDERGNVSADRIALDTTEPGTFTLNVSVPMTAGEAGVPEPAATDVGDLVGYVRVDHSVGDEDLSNVTLNLTVDWDVLVDGPKGGDIVVYRYHDGEWQPLETRIDHYSTRGVHLTARSPGLSVFAVGSEREAAFTVDEATVDATSATAGESVTVAVPVENGGTAVGETTLELAANDRTLTVETVRLAPGQSTTVELPATFDEPGEYELRVNGDVVDTVTVSAAGATATPAATATPESTPTATATPEATATPVPTATPTADPTPTPEDAGPTAGSGPGFGLAVALLALVLAALGARRRR